jgi:hypothetical protein
MGFLDDIEIVDSEARDIQEQTVYQYVKELIKLRVVNKIMETKVAFFGGKKILDMISRILEAPIDTFFKKSAQELAENYKTLYTSSQIYVISNNKSVPENKKK